ncbi:MAG: rRNA pseudouridine synthase [Lachnospiraceae bacterium]|nr:rRNA pseudouridine synthase [Lachnospiraceae bacterium]
MRLDKFLSNMNIGSRKEVKELVRAGRVSVNSVTARDAGMNVSESDLVVLDGKEISYEKYVYIMMNKPAGVISSTEDGHDRTVTDLIAPPVPKGLSPVGRLDKDTVGLMLLSNDGELAHRLLSPAHHVDKTYFVKVTGALTEEDVDAFKSGMELSDFTCLPAALKIIRSGDISEAEVTIHEGKFHQIKRMFAKRKKNVIYLKRLSMGTLTLDSSLEEGEYRRLTDEEVRALKNPISI